MCTFKTSPFVPAPRAHVFQHVCAWCRYTRGRFELTHGDVLSGHTEFRSVSHTNTHTLTHTTQHNTTQHNTTQHNTTQHNTLRPQHHTEKERDRDRQRQTETDRDRERRQGQREEKTEEERQDKRREDKRRQDKRREMIHFAVWWCMAFFVGVVICLVNPVCARDLSFLNSVQ